MSSSSSTLSDNAKWMKLGMQANLFPYYKQFRRKVIKYSGINSSSVTLDFGCGVGLLESFIIRHMPQYGKITGVDTGRELIEIARREVREDNNIEFLLIDKCGSLPFADNTFDIVISNLVFHLLNDNQKQKALGEISRVLKPGGRALFAEIGKPYNMFGLWIKFITLRLWTKIWPYESNSKDSFEGKFPTTILSAGLKNLTTLERIKGYIYFIIAIK